ncbi:hypothetical protein BSLG_001678 [Batrachochytrium salamandrivorans]|nr:hypothetical protein BSLG_001678 [Batrachochytrium salamandrivorans]
MHFNSVIIFLATIATLATELTLAALPSGSCSAPRVRKEWRRLTDGERSAFLSAVKALKARGPPRRARQAMEWLAGTMTNLSMPTEKSLRSIDSSIDLPFWDWSLDSQNPGASDIFSSQSFVVTVDQATTVLPHGVVHNQIGGDCGDMGGMYSANDPLFFMHHAMVDRIWARWQDQCNYSFTNLFVSDRNTPMTPFGYSPNDVLSIAAGTPLCYTYGPSASDAPSAPSAHQALRRLQLQRQASAIPTLSEDAIKNMLNDSWFKNVLLSLVPNAPHSQNTSTVSLHRRTPQEYQDPNSIDINAIVQQAVSAAVKAAGIPEIQLAGGLLNTILPTIYTPDPHVLIKAPPAGDFSDLKHLRQIQQVSASWIKMNRLNETFVRQCEVLSMHIIDQYNNRKGYVSSAALTNYGMYNKLDGGMLPLLCQISSDSLATPVSPVLKRASAFSLFKARWSRSAATPATPVSLTSHPDLHAINTTSAAAAPTTITSSVDAYPIVENAVIASGPPLHTSTGNSIIVTPSRTLSSTDSHIPSSIPGCMPHQPNSSGGMVQITLLFLLVVLMASMKVLLPLSIRPLLTLHLSVSLIRHHYDNLLYRRQSSSIQNTSSILMYQHAAPPSYLASRLKSDLTSMHAPHRVSAPPVQKESLQVLINTNGELEPLSSSPLSSPLEYTPSNQRRSIHMGALFTKHKVSTASHLDNPLSLDRRSMGHCRRPTSIDNRLSSSHSLVSSLSMDTSNANPSRSSESRRISHSYTTEPVRETFQMVRDYDSKTGNKMINHYMVVRELGRGCHGKSSYASIQNRAIKIVEKMAKRRFQSKLSAAARAAAESGLEPPNPQLERIKREIAILKKCTHPHVVRLREVIDDPHLDKIYLVLEYLEGGDISWSDHADPPTPALSVSQARDIFRDVVCGVQYLHYQGIVHRDIKPANLLWTADHRVKISDFGVSVFVGHKRKRLDRTSQLSPGSHSKSNISRVRSRYRNDRSRLSLSISRSHSGDDHLDRSGRGVLSDGGIFSDDGGEVTNDEDEYQDADELELAKTADQNSMGNNAEAQLTAHGSSRMDFKSSPFDAFVRSPNALSLEPFHLVPGASTNQPQMPTDATDMQLAVDRLSLRPTLPQSSTSPFAQKTIDSLEATMLPSARTVSGTNDAHRDSTASRHILYSHNSVSGIDGRFHTPLEVIVDSVSGDKSVRVYGKMPAESKTKLLGLGNDQIQDAARAISSPLGEPKASKLHFRDPSGDVDSEDAAEENGPLLGAPIDIWAMGVTLFCFVYGKVPFIAETEYGLFNVIVKQPLILPDKPPITDDLRDLFHRLLDKNPAKRATLNEIRVHPWIIGDMSLETRKRWLDETNPSFQYAERLFVSDDDVSQALTVMDRIRNRIRKISHSFHSLAAGLSFRRRTVSMPSVAGNALTPRAASAQSATASIPDRRALVVSPTAHASNGGMLQSPSLLHLQHPIIRSTSFGGAVPTATTRRSLRTTMMTPSSSLSANPQSQASPSRWSSKPTARGI